MPHPYDLIPIKRFFMRKTFFLTLISLSLLSGCLLEKPPQNQSNKAEDCLATIAQKNQTKPRTIAPTDLKTGAGFSTPVISNAQKFIIPVPAFGQRGEPLVYPSGYEKAGQPILDYTGKPIGDRGLVFFNGKDQSWQAVKGDGEGVIIINEVTQEQAKKLYKKVQSFDANPNNLTVNELKQVLAYAQKQLGLVDMYNSDRAYIKEKMTPAIAGKVPQIKGKEIEAYGLKKRDDRDVNQAIYIPGEFVFEGPAASPQKFKNGGVIVEQGGKMRGVQPDIFVKTYKLSDGHPVTSPASDLETQCGK